jgi:DNA-binding response OmpR family regulator
MRALLVDDDREFVRLLGEYLATHGVQVDPVHDGSRAIERLANPSEPYDIVVLDVMLPGIDGFEVCRRIRAQYDVPIVMLTARGEENDRVVGLDIGADDYVAKPFNPRELLARMRAILRRGRPKDAASERVVVGDLVIDVHALDAKLAGQDLPLTSFEFRLLVALAQRAGDTVTREQLAGAVLPKGDRYDPSVDRSLDVHVSHLRQKLGDDGREPRRIRTVRGVGYVLVKPSRDDPDASSPEEPPA